MKKDTGKPSDMVLEAERILCFTETRRYRKRKDNASFVRGTLFGAGLSGAVSTALFLLYLFFA